MTTPNDTLDGGRKTQQRGFRKGQSNTGSESNKQEKEKKPLGENSDVEQQMSEYCAHLFVACCINGYANRQFSPSGRNQHCQVSTMQPNWR